MVSTQQYILEIGRILLGIDQRLAQIATAVAMPAPAPINDRLSYTRRQAATALSVSVWTIDAARKKGLLRHANPLGIRDVRITGESLLRFQRQRP